MIGQTMAEHRLSPRQRFVLAQARPVMRSSYSGLGAVQPVVNLGDADIMLELKTMMTILAPALAQQGDAWFNAPWKMADWAAYKTGILAKLPGSAAEKNKMVAYTTKDGGVALGMPPVERVGFPSIFGISAMGTRLTTQGFMTNESLGVAFPKLTTAALATAANLKPGDPGVIAPSSSGSSAIPTWAYVAGGGVLLVGAYLLLKK